MFNVFDMMSSVSDAVVIKNISKSFEEVYRNIGKDSQDLKILIENVQETLKEIYESSKDRNTLIDKFKISEPKVTSLILTLLTWNKLTTKIFAIAISCLCRINSLCTYTNSLAEKLAEILYECIDKKLIDTNNNLVCTDIMKIIFSIVSFSNGSIPLHGQSLKKSLTVAFKISNGTTPSHKSSKAILHQILYTFLDNFWMVSKAADNEVEAVAYFKSMFALNCSAAESDLKNKEPDLENETFASSNNSVVYATTIDDSQNLSKLNSVFSIEEQNKLFLEDTKNIVLDLCLLCEQKPTKWLLIEKFNQNFCLEFLESFLSNQKLLITSKPELVLMLNVIFNLIVNLFENSQKNNIYQSVLIVRLAAAFVSNFSSQSPGCSIRLVELISSGLASTNFFWLQVANLEVMTLYSRNNLPLLVDFMEYSFLSSDQLSEWIDVMVQLIVNFKNCSESIISSLKPSEYVYEQVRFKFIDNWTQTDSTKLIPKIHLFSLIYEILVGITYYLASKMLHHPKEDTNLIINVEQKNSSFLSFENQLAEEVESNNTSYNNQLFNILINSIINLLSLIFVNACDDITLQSCLYHFQLLSLTTFKFSVEDLTAKVLEKLICCTLPQNFNISKFTIDQHKFDLKSILSTNVTTQNPEIKFDVVQTSQEYSSYILCIKNVAAMKALLNVVHNSISMLEPFYYLLFSLFAHLKALLFSNKGAADKPISEEIISLLLNTIEYIPNSTTVCSKGKLLKIFECLMQHVLTQNKQEHVSDSCATFFALDQITSLFSVNFGHTLEFLDQFHLSVVNACNNSGHREVMLIVKCIFNNLLVGINKQNNKEASQELVMSYLWKNFEVIVDVFSTTLFIECKTYVLNSTYDIIADSRNELFGFVWLMVLSIFLDAEVIQNLSLFQTSYRCIQIIVKDHIVSIPLDCIPFLTCLIGDFCRCLLDIEINLSAVGLLEVVGDHLSTMSFIEDKIKCSNFSMENYRSYSTKLSNKTLLLKSVTERFPSLFEMKFSKDTYETLWLILFENLFSLMYSKSNSICESSVHTIFRLLRKCESEKNVWVSIFDKWLLPSLCRAFSKDVLEEVQTEPTNLVATENSIHIQIAYIWNFSKIYESHIHKMLEYFSECLFKHSWKSFLDCCLIMSDSNDLGIVWAVVFSVCNFLKTAYICQYNGGGATKQTCLIDSVIESQEYTWKILKSILIRLHSHVSNLEYEYLIKPLAVSIFDLDKTFKMLVLPSSVFENFLDVVILLVNLPLSTEIGSSAISESIVYFLKNLFKGMSSSLCFVYFGTTQICQITSILFTCLSKFINCSYKSTCYKSLSELLKCNETNKNFNLFKVNASLDYNPHYKWLANRCLLALRDLWKIIIVVDKLNPTIEFTHYSSCPNHLSADAPEVNLDCDDLQVDKSFSFAAPSNLKVIDFMKDWLKWTYEGKNFAENNSTVVKLFDENFFLGISMLEKEFDISSTFLEYQSVLKKGYRSCRTWIEEHPISFILINKNFPDFCLIIGMLIPTGYSCMEGFLWKVVVDLFLLHSETSLIVITYDWMFKEGLIADGEDGDKFIPTLDEDCDENVDYLITLDIEWLEDKSENKINNEGRNEVFCSENIVMECWMLCTKLVENFLCFKKKMSSNSLPQSVLDVEKELVLFITDFMLVQCPPLISIRRKIITILIRGCEYIKRDAFMRMCCKSLFKLTGDNRTAPFVIPYLMSYSKAVIRRFINEDKKISILPLSVHRVVQVKTVLEQLKQLRIEPSYWRSQNNNQLIDQSRIKHIWLLFSFLCSCITCRENEIKSIVQKMFLDCAQELGIDNEIDIF